MPLGLTTWFLDHLSSDSSLGKIDSPLLISCSHWLSVTLHLGIGPSEISPKQIGMSPGGDIVHTFFRQPSVEMLRVQLPGTVEKTASQLTSWSPCSYGFLASSQMLPEPWCRGYIFLTTPVTLICSPESALMCFYGRRFAISPSELGRSWAVTQFSLILSKLCLFAENARLLKREKRCRVLSKPFWSYAVLQVSLGKPLSILKNKDKGVYKIIYLTMQLLRRFSIYYLKIP